MSDIDVSKIPAEVMATATAAIEKIFDHDPHGTGLDWFKDEASAIIAVLILHERAACAQHAFAMRWAPSPELAGTKNAALISRITTDWSQKIGMGILNR